ncbi:hypothetical protein G5714_014521 [Onychostoma macrolepis]|uniref:FACT complex subunit SSRP1 n=1 Tax=Onychostoma macrolepis TaxID=369639 RepID=A0A7J6CDA4_9TELE|nr:hypothetical protein G5714_014521 [Onychostoma macrolepis]
MSEDEVEKHFEGMSGPLCEIVSRVKKTSSGLLYPLERGFIYVHKPLVHLLFEETSCINFTRGTTTTRSFDSEIETKQNNQYTFRH